MQTAKNHTVLIDSDVSSKFASRAGSTRAEVIELVNENGDSMNVPELFDGLRVYICHTEKRDIIIRPGVRIMKGRCYLIWRPIVRGLYKMVMNGCIIETGYTILVLSNQRQIALEQLSVPSNKSSNFRTELSIYAYYQDEFANPYTHLEAQLDAPVKDNRFVNLGISVCDCDFPCEIKDTHRSIDRFGKQQITFYLTAEEIASLEANIEFTLQYEDLEIQRFSIFFKGLSLEQRLKQLYQELSKLGHSS